MAGTVNMLNYQRNSGEVEDGPAVQRAIEQCVINGGGVLEFEEEKTYIVNSELHVYGNYSKTNSSLTINGNNSILRKTEHCASNNLGGLFTISGTSEPATGIVVNKLNLVFIQVITKSEPYTNGFSIVKADGVTLNECTVYGAPQTSFAVVADDNKDINNVLLYKCIGKNSYKHTFRLSAVHTGSFFKAKMQECEGINTINYDTHYNMDYNVSGGRRVHLLVNVSNPNPIKANFSQVIQDCTFDSTGGAYITGPCPYVEFKNCYFPFEKGSNTSAAIVKAS